MINHTEVTIRSSVNNQVVVGREVKRYDRGLTVEDKQGVIHYVSYDRVVDGNYVPPATKTNTVTNSSVKTVSKVKYLPKNVDAQGRTLNSDGSLRKKRTVKK